MNLNKSYLYKESWFVLRVKVRHENKVSEILNKLNFKTYNPTINFVRKWSDRLKKIKLPAIPGIIFVQSNLKEKNKVFCSSSIKGWLYDNNNPATVSQNDLKLLEENLNERSWVGDDKKIILGNIIFLEHLGIDVIINKIGMSHIWANIKRTNLTLKLKREVV
mgnify:CR=1 FL=1|tara:strand:- start:918 stop:1406 length:489 start_codon:yes stop_codon:yes gene_type:complete